MASKTSSSDKPFAGQCVLHVILAMGRGGAERLVRTLAVHWSRQGAKALVACLDEIETVPEEFPRNGVELALVKRRPGFFDARLCLALARLARRRRVDILHAHDLTSALHCAGVSLLTGKPALFTEHSRHYLEERWLRRLEKRLVCSRLAAVAEVSPVLAQASRDRDHVAAGKIRIIENGVDTESFAGADAERFRADLGVKADRRLIGMVGRLETIKGPQVLLEAFATLAADQPDLDMVFVGQGGLSENLAERVRQLGLQGRVFLPGPRDDIPEVLAALDLVVLPSLSEGLPFLLLEAMAAGKPIVASAVGHIPSVLRNGRTGILTPPAEPATLAAAMALLLHHPETAKEMGARAQAEVASRFGVDTMLKAYEALYQELLPPRRR